MPVTSTEPPTPVIDPPLVTVEETPPLKMAVQRASNCRLAARSTVTLFVKVRLAGMGLPWRSANGCILRMKSLLIDKGPLILEVLEPGALLEMISPPRVKTNGARDVSFRLWTE